MDGYYDPHPLLALERPLTLVGHPGSGVAATGRMICGRTGLPFNDVERATEAMAGRSRAQIAVEEGVPRLLALEAEALEQAVSRRPNGVVVIGSALLEDAARNRWLRTKSLVVYLQRPARVLLARIRRQLANAPASLPEFVLGVPGTPADLERHLAARSAALAALDLVFEAGDQHPARVAEAILRDLASRPR